MILLKNLPFQNKSRQYSVLFLTELEYQKHLKENINDDVLEFCKDSESMYNLFLDSEYCGLCLNIHESLCEKIVDNFGKEKYKNYNCESQYDEYLCKTAKESFLTLSNLKYCIIKKIQLKVS